MKSSARRYMKMVVGFFAVLTPMLLSNIAQAQVPATNIPAGQVIPVLEMHDVPISSAVENLARQAGINCLIAPLLTQKWAEFGEPPVSFRLENAVAKDVLVQILSLRHIALVEDPVSNIAFIIPAGEIGNPLFSGMATNAASQHTNLIPLIQFSDVPITTAIENLARQEGVNYILTPKVAREWDGSSTHGPVQEPLITVRLEQVTCWSALNRMLNIRGLVLAEDPATGVARIAFRDGRLPRLDTSLLDTQTNSSDAGASQNIPVIQFSAVPLDEALEHLSRQCGLQIELDPRLKDDSDPQNRLPTLDLRWTNLTARQALVAICENYDLAITKDDATGAIQIKPERFSSTTDGHR